MSVEMSDGVELRGDVPEGEHTAGPAPATPPNTPPQAGGA